MGAFLVGVLILTRPHHGRSGSGATQEGWLPRPRQVLRRVDLVLLGQEARLGNKQFLEQVLPSPPTTQTNPSALTTTLRLPCMCSLVALLSVAVEQNADVPHDAVDATKTSEMCMFGRPPGKR